jgi:hypothetical protein
VAALPVLALLLGLGLARVQLLLVGRLALLAVTTAAP